MLNLELTADLPEQSKIDRWFSEPVKAIIIPTSLFLSNRSGFPVLSKAHQKCIFKFFKVIMLKFYNGNLYLSFKAKTY